MLEGIDLREWAVNGPGMALVGARQRVKKLVLELQLAEMEAPADGMWHDQSPVFAKYEELTEAARDLVLADDRFKTALRERAERYGAVEPRKPLITGKYPRQDGATAALHD